MIRIQFIIERETDGKLAVLDVLVLSTTYGGLQHKIYRRILSPVYIVTLNIIPGAGCSNFAYICEPQYLDEDFGHLDAALQLNGYSAAEVR